MDFKGSDVKPPKGVGFSLWGYLLLSSFVKWRSKFVVLHS